MELFKALDKDSNCVLDIGEFSTLVKKIDFTVDDDEVKIVFNLFDRNKNGGIDFMEFRD